ncbi:hypothetical protein ACIBEH_32835 [Nocardia salmonicida]|uniref:hypothetical protein n=1 Tax=Nocardia salmonicida TaxID=53431 RepID=UPI0037AD0FF4
MVPESSSCPSLLPPGTDIDQIVKSRNVSELIAVWNTYHHRRRRAEVLAALDARALNDIGERSMLDQMADSTLRELHGRELRKTAVVSEIQALAANQRLVETMLAGRWAVMDRAHQQGSTWLSIGQALGMTKQGAVDWYRRKKPDINTSP